MQPFEKSFGYIPAIDGLRGVAVLLVLLFHFGVRGFSPGGYIGVDIFYVISGFLITSILLKEFHTYGCIGLANFYKRRILRIFPAFIMMIAVYSAIAAASRSHVHLCASGTALLEMMNWARAFGFGCEGFLGHTWSLSAEEQFYLAWPPLLSLSLSKFSWKRGGGLWMLSFLILAIVCWRVYLVVTGSPADRTYNGLDTHADGLLLGCLLAFTGGRLPGIGYKEAWPIPVALLAIITMFLPYDAYFIEATGLTVGAISAGWVIAIVYSGHPCAITTVLSNPMMVRIGKLSYSLYLWHYPILRGLEAMKIPEQLLACTGIPLSFMAAFLSYKFVETPFLKRKQAFSRVAVSE